MAKEAATPVINANEEIKFRDDLTSLADKLEEKIVIGEGGTLTLPAGVFFENAPEEVTEKSYEAQRKYTDLFNNAATLAGSRKSVELFKGKKDLAQATLHAPIWKKDSYEGVFKREGTSRNVKTGEVSNYKGSIGVGRIEVTSTRTQTEWQSIKQNMRSLAESAGL